MPSKLRGEWTIAKVLAMTYRYFNSRFDYLARDVIKSSIQIKETKVYDGRSPGEMRTRYDIITASYPQYYPYFTKHDSRGRPRTRQRTYRHQYTTILQLDKLSMDVPFKSRVGANRKYQFDVAPQLIKSKSNPHGRYLSVADFNIAEKGINPDFYFCFEFVYSAENCLFGKCYSQQWPDERHNRYRIPGFTKHQLHVVLALMNYGILKIK